MTEQSNNPIIRATDLEFVYDGGTTGLAGASLDVPVRSRLAILGPNGGGKTTLLLHLVGLLKPDKGSVFLDGRPAGYGTKALREWRSMVGLIFQDPDDQLFAASVFEDVSYGPMNLGLAEDVVRRRVEQALADMEIADLAGRPVHMLSLGQKKRVAIAGVLAMRPQAILFDEPTSGLDGQAVEQLLNVLDRLSSGGTTIVISTHNVNLALAFAETVALMDAGKIIASGPAAEILADGELLARCRLREPLAISVARGLKTKGILPADSPQPRDLPALLELIANNNQPKIVESQHG